MVLFLRTFFRGFLIDCFRTLSVLGVVVFSVNVHALSNSNSFGMLSESFVSPDYRATESRQFNFIGFESNRFISNPNSTSIWGLDGSIQMSVDSPALHRITPNEAYYQFRQNSSSLDWTLGRKRMLWSRADEDWGLGFFQPLDRQNPLKPHPQGLTGGFINGFISQGTVPVRFRLWGSMIHIPDQGPGFVLKDGEFQKSNPWFQPLPEEIRLSGSDKVRRIEYSVRDPDLAKMVLQPGLLAQLGFGFEKGLSLQVSAGRKTQNSLLFGLEGRAVSDPLAYVDIAATTAVHSLYSADLYWDNEVVQLGIGGLVDDPQAPADMDPVMTYLVPKPVQILSTTAGFQFGRSHVRALGLLRSGGEIQAMGPKAADFTGMLGEKVYYRQAAALDYEYEFSDRRAWLNTRWTQGLDTQTSLWDLSVRYFWNRNWSTTTSLFMIRGQPGSTSSATLVALEDNDAVHFGVNYAF